MDYLLIIDSGIGGLNQLKLIKKEFPCLNVIYFADNKYCPYGSKSKSFLINRALKIISKISKNYSISSIVIACNTLSTCALSCLKKKHKNIYGTFPPIVKKNKSILLCTPKTANEVKKHTNNPNCIVKPLKHLAKMIENNHHNFFNFSTYLLKKVPQISKYQNIILGCTHYTYIIKYIKELNPYAKIYDSNQSAFDNYKKMLYNQGENKTIILLSKKNETTKNNIINILQENNILKSQIMYCHIN